jgi:hypothetical protein
VRRCTLTYWTQGVVTFHAPANKISINPHTDYAVTHEKDKYTSFVEKHGDDVRSRIFPTTQIFAIVVCLKEVLIKAAISKILLRIGVDIDLYDRVVVSEVIIPARSEVL